MKAFLTGGTGFIGSRVVGKLIAHNYQVFALVRSEKGAQFLQELGAQTVLGDILDIESMQEAMRGSDVVFHLAAWYKLGSRNWKEAEKINVDGTQNVLSLAYELEIPHTIYTSTVAVFGDTHGEFFDEEYMPPEGPFLTEYDRTKWLAHFKVALPLINQGAPITILMPGVVYGPGDHSLIGQMMRLFYKGYFPVLPGPELTLTYAHVDDIAEGHILALTRGKPGQSYILAGPAYTLGEMAKIWAEVSGKRAPSFSIPSRWIKPLAPLMGALQAIIPLPPVFSRDALRILGATYIARADKAKKELGWQNRPVIEGMRQTFNWIAKQEIRSPR